jgi:hypothetical protein
MTAFTRSFASFGLLLSLGACGIGETPAETDPGQADATAAPLGPAAATPVMAAITEPAAEPDAPMIYAGRTDVGDASDLGPDPAVDPRDPSLVPDGTPDENATAFFAMRKSRRDGAPVGGIGPDGIHVDSLVVGRGFSNSRCESESHAFSVETDERVNVCLRAVHAGHTEQALTVKWTRDGRGPKATRLSLHNSHAYRTRAWLPVHDDSKGDWHVSVSASDGTVLGEADFAIE